MPTARFEADFSSFIAAINAAQYSMADMGKGADTVQQRLNAMVDQFSGRELIQEASLMTIAIEKMGGVAMLTGDELTQVGDKAAEAVDKLHALGTDVPEGLQKLADATAANTSAQEQWNEVIGVGKELLGGLGISLGLSGLIEFGGHVLDTADKIEHFSKTTGMTTDEVQQLMYIADQSGTHFDTLANAVTTLEQKMGSGNKGLQAALLDLGIGFQDFLAESPYDKLLSVGEAMAKLDDSDRKAADGAAIFGKSWREVAAAINESSAAVGAAAPKMTEQAIKALTDLEKRWKDFESNVVVAAANIVAKMDELRAAMQLTGMSDEQAGKIIDRMNGISDAMRNMKGPALELPPIIQDLAFDFDKLMATSDEMTTKVEALIDTEKAQAAFLVTWEAATKKLQLAEDDWRATLAEIDPALVTEAERLMKLGLTAEEAAARVGLLPEQIQAVNNSMKETDAYAKAIANIDDATTNWKATLDELNPALVAMAEGLLAAGAKVKDVAAVLPLADGQVRALKQDVDDNTTYLKKFQAAFEDLIKSTTDWKAAAEALSPVTRQTILDQDAAGVTIEHIATLNGVAVETVKALIAANKELQQSSKDTSKVQQDGFDLQSASYNEIMDHAAKIRQDAAYTADAIRLAAVTTGGARQADIDKANEEANSVVAAADARAKAEEDAAKRITGALTSISNARNAGGKFTAGSPEEQAAMTAALAEVNATSLGQMIAQGTQNVDLMNQYQLALETAMANRGFSIGGGLTPAAMAAGASAGTGTNVNTTVNVQGSTLGTSQSIAAAVSQAMTQTLKSLGYSLPAQ
jgi:hypothetical protein